MLNSWHSFPRSQRWSHGTFAPARRCAALNSPCGHNQHGNGTSLVRIHVLTLRDSPPTRPTSSYASRLASMGGSSSKERFLSAPLTPQRKFPFLVSQRFCQSRTTTITLHDNFWFKTGAEGYAIKDAFSGKEIFHVQPALDGVTADPKTKWLVDAYKIPVAHMHETWTYTMAYNMHVGKESEYYLTQAEVKFIPLHRNPLYAEYQNPETGEKSRIGVHGDWRQRTVFIYIDRGMTGSRHAIAKVFRPEGKHVPFGSGEYRVEVVSGADVAFVVLICAAMDDALQQSIDDPKK